MIHSKNKRELNSFTEYCNAHPEERFWQALRNWNKIKHPEECFIFVGDIAEGEVKFFDKLKDTFFR